MNTIPLNVIFDIEYGNQLDYVRMRSSAESNAVNFISRSSKNFGIIDTVEVIPSIIPYEAGLITVCLGGSILETFVQPSSFYTAQNIKVLRPRIEMSFNEKLYYCICIRRNKFRYSSHGREANVSLDTLLVPDSVPVDFLHISLGDIVSQFRQPSRKGSISLKEKMWGKVKISDIFDIRKGARILNREMRPGSTPCVRATSANNGITAYIDLPPNHDGNTITVSYNGSVGEAFYQPQSYFALDDVNVLYAKFAMNSFHALFSAPS